MFLWANSSCLLTLLDSHDRFPRPRRAIAFLDIQSEVLAPVAAQLEPRQNDDAPDSAVDHIKSLQGRIGINDIPCAGAAAGLREAKSAVAERDRQIFQIKAEARREQERLREALAAAEGGVDKAEETTLANGDPKVASTAEPAVTSRKVEGAGQGTNEFKELCQHLSTVGPGSVDAALLAAVVKALRRATDLGRQLACAQEVRSN